MADLTTAFLEGSRQMAKADTVPAGNPVSVGNPVGTVGEYDPRTSPVYETAHSADKISGFGLKPGQVRGHFGTTVFMPKRNDPEVEAVLGPHVYNEKVSKTSADAMRLEQIELKNMIAQQAAQIATLTALIVGQNTGQNTGQNSEAKFVTHGETKINIDKNDDKTVAQDYRAIAKTAGIKTFGRKKEEVVTELTEKGLM